MNSSHFRRALGFARASALVIATGALTWCLAWLTQSLAQSTPLQRGYGPWRIDDLVAITCGAAGTLIGLYLTLTGALFILTSSSRSGWAFVSRIAPATWRKVVGASLGAAVASGAAVPAIAATDPAPDNAGWVHVETVHEEPRSHSAAPLAVTPIAAASEAPDSEATPTVTVAPGDSLWSIAADHGVTDGSAAEINDAWRDLYDHNREAVGDDPGLIHPGDTLALPEGWRA